MYIWQVCLAGCCFSAKFDANEPITHSKSTELLFDTYEFIFTAATLTSPSIDCYVTSMMSDDGDALLPMMNKRE
jgi:hypothetical protein